MTGPAIRWLDNVIPYDGSQLRSHWILRTTGIVGDAIIGFRGPCAVLTAEMADLDDLLAGETIAGDDMVHLIWETFDAGDLVLAVHRQRLLSAQALEILGEMISAAPRPNESGARDAAPSEFRLRRTGDDLYLGEGKLSISIATRSTVSSLLHFAVNCTNSGTPVATASLADLGVDPMEFGHRLLARAAEEQVSIARARAQVRPKGEDGRE